MGVCMLMLAGFILINHIFHASKNFRGAAQIFFSYHGVKVLHFFFVPYKGKKGLESKLYKHNSIGKILRALNA